jgi:hypothetical protein
MKTETLDTLANVSSKVTAAGATTSVVGTFLINNMVGVIGLLIALLGYLTNTHYRRKANKRRDQEATLAAEATKQAMLLQAQDAEQKKAYWALRMELLKSGIDVGPPSDVAPLCVVPAARGPEDEDER